MKFFCSLILIIGQAYAQVDFKYAASARSYPTGGSMNAEAGYSQMLWGTAGGDNLMYGLIRPSINYDTSGVVSATDSKITFFPISFIGFGAGHKSYKSTYEDFEYYNCEDEVRCTGDMEKDYNFGKVALALSNILTSYTYTEYRNGYEQVDDNNYGVAEYETVTIANPLNEEVIQRSTFLGYKMGEDLIGLVSDQHHFQRSEKNSQMTLGIYKIRYSMFDILTGIGSFHSSDYDPGAVAILRINHTLLPSMALF